MPGFRITTSNGVALGIAVSVVLGIVFPVWGIPVTSLVGGLWLIASVLRRRPLLAGLADERRRKGLPLDPRFNRERVTRASTVATSVWGWMLILQFAVLAALALTITRSQYDLSSNVIVGMTYLVGIPLTIAGIRRFSLARP